MSHKVLLRINLGTRFGSRVWQSPFKPFFWTQSWREDGWHKQGHMMGMGGHWVESSRPNQMPPHPFLGQGVSPGFPLTCRAVSDAPLDTHWPGCLLSVHLQKERFLLTWHSWWSSRAVSLLCRVINRKDKGKSPDLEYSLLALGWPTALDGHLDPA